MGPKFGPVSLIMATRWRPAGSLKCFPWWQVFSKDPLFLVKCLKIPLGASVLGDRLSLTCSSRPVRSTEREKRAKARAMATQGLARSGYRAEKAGLWAPIGISCPPFGLISAARPERPFWRLSRRLFQPLALSPSLRRFSSRAALRDASRGDAFRRLVSHRDASGSVPPDMASIKFCSPMAQVAFDRAAFGDASFLKPPIPRIL